MAFPSDSESLLPSELLPARVAPREGEFAVRFFGLVLAGTAGSIGLAWLLYRIWPLELASNRLLLPWPFWVSTALLFVSSAQLSRAVFNVRLERQAPFRKALRTALGCGLLFVSLQSYGLSAIVPATVADRSAEGVHAFVFVFIFLHAMHFVVANLFLIFVTLKAHDGRYDHEYYWGVTICGWFWHLLGVIWMLILLVFVFANV